MSVSRNALAAELLGTAALLAIVVGSGIMGARLSAGNDGLALLANSLATGAGLTVLIWSLGPISGAHFNPVVSALAAWRGEQPWPVALAYAGVQCAGAVAGVWLAHAMFGEPVLQVSSHLRAGPAQWLSEMVATAGLLGTIVLVSRRQPLLVGPAVGLYIMAAYWFTASTSFANPAVTLARSLTNTFAGIAPASVPGFLLGQAGALLLVAALLPRRGMAAGAAS